MEVERRTSKVKSRKSKVESPKAEETRNTEGKRMKPAKGRAERIARVGGALAVSLLPYGGVLLGLLLLAEAGKREPVPRRSVPEPLVPAPRGRRAAAGFLDIALSFLLLLVPYAGWALSAGFLLFRDSLFDGRGFGKRLMGLTAARDDGAGPRTLAGDHLASFARNATVGLPLAQILLVPVEAALVLLGARRIGDRLAGGPVVVSWRGRT